MSDTTSASLWGVRAVRAGVLSLALAALAALGLASQANADFTIPQMWRNGHRWSRRILRP